MTARTETRGIFVVAFPVLGTPMSEERLHRQAADQLVGILARQDVVLLHGEWDWRTKKTPRGTVLIGSHPATSSRPRDQITAQARALAAGIRGAVPDLAALIEMDLGPAPVAGPKRCAVDGCPDVMAARGWYDKHYARWRAHGDPLAGGPPRFPHAGECDIEGCDRPVKGRGWCEAHLKRWHRTGDPLSSSAGTRPVAERLDELLVLIEEGRDVASAISACGWNGLSQLRRAAKDAGRGEVIERLAQLRDGAVLA